MDLMVNKLIKEPYLSLNREKVPFLQIKETKINNNDQYKFKPDPN